MKNIYAIESEINTSISTYYETIFEYTNEQEARKEFERFGKKETDYKNENVLLTLFKYDDDDNIIDSEILAEKKYDKYGYLIEE